MAVLVEPQDLARTYNSQSYEDAWEAVEDYQRVLEYTGRHRNKGSSAVASALNLPRGRVHPWMNGSRPAPVRAIQVAEENEWIPLATDDEDFPAFNQLVAWIFSRGSISADEYSPMFVCPTDDEQARLTALLDRIDVPFTLYRTDDTDRATEARLTEHRTIIGRILSELGAPLGPRKQTTQLPEYLKTGSRTVQFAFARTYLANVAQYWDWRNGYVIRHDAATETYLEELASFFTEISEIPSKTAIEANPDSVFLPEAVVEEIRADAA